MRRNKKKKVRVKYLVNILDCNYLCYYLAHKYSCLSSPELITYFLEEVKTYVRTGQFHNGIICFCWDVGLPLRKKTHPEYKDTKARKDQNDVRKVVKEASKWLRQRYLPAMGFRNVFWKKGFESDDVIAKLTQELAKQPKRYEVVIASGDYDLFQLLTENVSQYLPKQQRHVFLDDFRKDYGIEPAQWATVKAVAGCSSDNVIGIPSIGEKTMIKYLRNELNTETKTYKKLVENYQKTYDYNIELVELPYKGTPNFKIDFELDYLDRKGCVNVYRHIGFDKTAVIRNVNGFFR